MSLRKKGGEFDAKNWALVTFVDAASAGRALFSKVRDTELTAATGPAHSECFAMVCCTRRWLSTKHLTRSR